MTPDTELLAFATKWLPFGGAPAEDVFITFGLTAERFRERLAAAMVREATRIAPATARALAELYRL